jgi:hypothetical protein
MKKGAVLLFFSLQVFVLSMKAQGQVVDPLTCTSNFKGSIEMEIRTKTWGIFNGVAKFSLRFPGPGIVSSTFKTSSNVDKETYIGPQLQNSYTSTRWLQSDDNLNCAQPANYKNCVLSAGNSIDFLDQISSYLITSSSEQLHRNAVACARSIVVSHLVAVMKVKDTGAVGFKLADNNQISFAMNRLESLRAKEAADEAKAEAESAASTAQLQSTINSINSSSYRAGTTK